MADVNPTEKTYLAVIGEWSSPSRRGGGLVGAAFPIFRITDLEVVSDPMREFPDQGSIFLPSRGNFRSWELVWLQPSPSKEHIPGKAEYVCFTGDMGVYDDADDQISFAILLILRDFDPSGNSIHNPPHDTTPVFFVRKKDKVYGPIRKLQATRSNLDRLESIEWEPFGDDSILYEFTDGQLLEQGWKPHTFTFPREFSQDEVVLPTYHLLSGDLRSLKGGTVLDRLPDARLAEWYLRFARVSLSEEMTRSLRGASEALFSAQPELIRRRCTRVAEMMDRLDALASARTEMSRQFLESEGGKKQLEQEMRKEVQRRSASLEADVSQMNAKLAAEKERLEEQLRRQEEEYSTQKARLDGRLYEMQQQQAQLEVALESLKAQLGKGLDQLTSQVNDNFPLLAAVAAGLREVAGSGSSTPQREAATLPQDGWQRVPPLEPTRPIGEVAGEAVLLDSLEVSLASDGLRFTRDFLANLYICLKASALNLIMGPPGYGKSSVVSGLARALGQGNALLEIAVRRAWSDDRYLLGFWDSFHGRYEPGPTGLATRLLQAQRDWEGVRQAVCLILLDEFNLAAPEYYFSQLLQVVTRPPEQIRRLRLFDASSLQMESAGLVSELTIHPNVRFWGTINYDETTERLSPRLLDRTGMIFLTARDVLESVETKTPEAGSLLAQGISARLLFEKFTCSPEDCPDRLWEGLKPFLELLKKPSEDWGPGIDISPRVLNAVERYLANVGDLLTDGRAVDFVFQQRIVPVLRGRGDPFLRRLDALKVELSKKGLERSAAHIGGALTQASANLGDVDLLAYS